MYKKQLAYYRNRKRPQPIPRTYGRVAVQGEMKYFDSNKAPTAIVQASDWTGTEQDPTTLNTLFVPEKGAGINERIGRKVNLLKLRVKGTVIVAPQGAQTAGDARAVIRLALVQDMQTNATQVQGEEVFDGTTGTGATAVNAFQSLENLGRFKVLKDKHVVLQNPNAIDTDKQQGLARTFKWDVIFSKPVSVSFNATNGGTVADIVDNSFHVLANTDSTNLVPQISYVARCYYKE